jgi:hypothetical protein
MKNSLISNTINQVPQIVTEKNDQSPNQTFPLFLQSIQNNINVSHHLDPQNQGRLPQKFEQFHTKGPLMPNSNNLVKRVQFINSFTQNKPYTTPIIHTDLHSIGTPSANGIKIKINNPSPILHIQQEKKI